MTGLARWLATVCRLGELLPAPGTTVGSLTGVLLFALVTRLLPASPRVVSALGLVVLLPLAVWACGAEALRRGVTDPGPVVLDEVAGQWLALAVLTAWRPGVPKPWVLGLSFLLFRAFDILKPWPISALERLPGGVGIVADDLAAGLAAGCVQVLVALALGT